MFNFFNYFIAVYLIVFGSVIFWFGYQYILELKLLKTQSINHNKEMG